MNAIEEELEILYRLRDSLSNSRLNAGILMVHKDGSLEAMKLQDVTSLLATTDSWIHELEERVDRDALS